MKIGLFVDKGTELMELPMKWGIFMDEWGEFGEVVHEIGVVLWRGKKERRREEGGDWQAKCCAEERERGVGLRGKIFENVE